MRVLAWFFTLAGLALASPLSAETITGSAFYRERILPPPGSVFEAILSDVSLADAPATELARFEGEGRAGPPYRFSLDYDPATIDPSRTYAVRAALRDSAGRLLFTSDTHTPVLTRGAGREVEIMMVRVPGDRADAPPSIGAHGLGLPASFTGTLPCAECEGIAHHLDLWPDQSYHLRRTWLGRDGDNRRDELGLWHADPGRNAIVLFGGDDTSTRWEVRNERSLRMLDRDGNPIDSELNYTLTSDGALTETDLEGLFLGGMMRYMADAASFEECVTGKTYPIAMEGGYLDLERAYLKDRDAPGAPLYVAVAGSLLMRPAMEGPDRRSLVIERFVATRPGITCERQRANASLTNTYWRIESLRGEPVTPAPGAREPHIVFLEGEGPRYAATVGCNRMGGSYTRGDTELSFGAGMTTMMACPPPLDTLERGLASVLSDVRGYGIAGQTLALQDGDGTVIALLTAVYLR